MSIREVSHRLTDTRLLLEQLRIAAHSDGASPRSFATLLKKAAETRAWEGEFPAFRAFMEAPEPQGLGLDDQTFLNIARLGGVEQLAGELLYGDIKAPTSTVGRPRNDSNTIILPSRGATVENVVARLRRDDPNLAEKVIRGEISANKAARLKGWRRPYIVVSTPERIAASLRKHMTREQLLELARLLTEQEGDN